MGSVHVRCLDEQMGPVEVEHKWCDNDDDPIDTDPGRDIQVGIYREGDEFMRINDSLYHKYQYESID